MKPYDWRRLGLLLGLWLAFGLRLYQLDLQSIWWDEGHSIFVASQPITAIPTLPAMDVHPPAYFSLLNGWMKLAGRTEFALRYLSVLFSIATLPLLWRFGRSLVRQPGSLAPLLALLLGAVSPLYVAYGQEVRSYAMLTGLALASTYTLWLTMRHYTRQNRAPVRLLLLYVLLTAACLYTHYFTLFLLVFHNLAWLAWVWSGRAEPPALKKRLLVWPASQLGVLLLFAPQLALALRQVADYSNPNLSPPNPVEFITRSWQAYTTGLTAPPALANWGSLLIALVLLANLFRLLRPNPSAPNRPPPSNQQTNPVQRSPFTILFLAAWFLIPLFIYFLALQVRPSFEPRYMILVTPALFLLLALGAAVPSGRRVANFVLSLLPLLIFAAGLYRYYTYETTFKDDSAGTAAWLAAETTANDIVFVDVPHPFHYYVERYDIAAPTRYLFVDIHTAADLLTREAAGRDRLFWVTWRGSDTDPRQVIPFLAQKYGRLLGEQAFRGYRVTWFSLPEAGTSFRLPARLPPFEATFGQILRLDGAAYGGDPPAGATVPAGRSGWATLHFTLLQDTDVDYRVSVRLVGENGRVAAQVDRDLLNDRHFHTSAWPAADPALNQAINVYTLPAPPDTPPGSYRVEVVVYDARPPYPSEGVTGAATADGAAAVLGYMTVTPPE